MTVPRKVFGRRLSRLSRLLASQDEEPEEVDGPRLGKYVLRGEVARGGMGVVYEAYDPELKRRVALKVLRPDRESDKLLVRLQREATITAQLQHPHIVAVHEVGEHEGAPYIAMDFVEGTTLAEIIRGRTVPQADLIRMLEEVARAVAYAHEKGVVHRDLKPANVLVARSGRTLLSDFGLARADLFQSDLTKSLALIGTPQYMAPEQFQGNAAAIGPHTDIYALGVMLYEILRGRPPFEATTPEVLYRKIMEEEPERPSRHGSSASTDLEIICFKAMSKDPKSRYDRALDFAEDLVRFQRGEPIQARTPGLGYRLRRWASRRKAVVAIGSAALLALISAMTVLLTILWAERELANRTLELGNLVSDVRADFDRYARAGETIHGWNRLEEGIEFCRSFLKKDDVPHAHLFLGQLLKDRGDRKAAIEELDLASELWEARFERGILLVDEYVERVHQARRRMGINTLLLPSSTEVEEGRADLRALRERAEADLDVKRSESLYVRELNLLFAQAELARVRGQDARATLLLEKILGIDPIYHRAWTALAFISWLDRRWEECVERATRAVNCHQSHARGYIMRGSGYLSLASEKQKDPRREDWIRRGLSDVNKALDLGDRSEQVYNLRGHAHYLMEEYSTAIEDIGRAIAIDDKYAGSYSNRASAYYRQGRPNFALSDLDKAVRLNPRWAPAYFNRAYIRAMMKQWDQVEPDLEASLELDPDQPEGWYLRGRARFELKKFGKAAQDFDEAIRRKPKRDDFYYWRGRTREFVSSLDRAIDDYTAAMELNPADSKYPYNRAICRYTKQNFRGALADVNLAIDIHSTSRLHAFRAAVRDTLGMKEGAIEDARKALGMQTLAPYERRQMLQLLRKYGLDD